MLHSGNHACRDQLGSTSPYKETTTGHDWFTEITTCLSQLSELGYTMDRLRIYLTACVISVGEKYKRCLYFTVFMFKCQISCHPVSIGHSPFPRTMSGFGQYEFPLVEINHFKMCVCLFYMSLYMMFKLFFVCLFLFLSDYDIDEGFKSTCFTQIKCSWSVIAQGQS